LQTAKLSYRLNLDAKPHP